MKKFLLMALASLVSIFASAQINESEAEDMTKVVYAKSGAVQQGTTGTIDIVLKSDEAVGTIACWFTLPDGVTVDALGSTSKGAITYNFHEGLHKFTIYNGATWAASGSTPVVIASIKVNVPEGVELGEYPLYTQHWEVTTPGLLTIEGDVADNQNILANVTVQKTAIIDEMPEGYGFEIIPFTLSANEKKDITVYMKNALDVYNMDITVNLPEGISNQYTSGSRGAKTYTSAKLDKSNLYSTTDGDVTALTLKQSVTNSGATINYKLENEGGDSYLPTEDYVPAFTIPVVGSATLAEGVYNLSISLSKVNAIDYEDEIAEGEFATYDYAGGEYLASVIVGQPAAQEVILYGHYTNNAVEAFNTAMKNVAVANITAIEKESGSSFKDVITVDDNKKWVYYYRQSENFATTVMPYDLGVTMLNDEYCQLFTVEDMTSESIILKELSQGECIPANTPCVFKGLLSFLKENMPLELRAIDDQIVGGITFKGTYETTNIAAGEGYYIASNGKFYNDGATVRPFRAYFKGNANGVKSFNVLLDTEDGLIDITNQFSEEDIYSLQGIKMNKAKKGVNIINGKKILKK